ncbi:hypothetical protein SB85_09250 [Xanthomonas sacchari]|nr:hypothetical protein SB85_09250 [Xanthomonas sacchari]
MDAARASASAAPRSRGLPTDGCFGSSIRRPTPCAGRCRRTLPGQRRDPERLSERAGRRWEGACPCSGLRAVIPWRYAHIRYPRVLPDGTRLQREAELFPRGWSRTQRTHHPDRRPVIPRHAATRRQVPAVGGRAVYDLVSAGDTRRGPHRPTWPSAPHLHLDGGSFVGGCDDAQGRTWSGLRQSDAMAASAQHHSPQGRIAAHEVDAPRRGLRRAPGCTCGRDLARRRWRPSEKHHCRASRA